MKGSDFMDYNLKATMWDMRETQLIPYDFEKGGEQWSGEYYHDKKVYAYHLHDTLGTFSSSHNAKIGSLPQRSFIISVNGWLKRTSGAVGNANSTTAMGGNVYLNSNRVDIYLECTNVNSGATYDFIVYYIHE